MDISIQKKRGRRKVILVVALLIVGLVLSTVFGFVAYVRLPLLDYYMASTKAFRIPALNQNFVPQGLHYDAERNHFLVGGYCSDQTASSVCFVNREDGSLEKLVRLSRSDGSIFDGHASGIAVWGDFVYIASVQEQALYVWSYEELLAAEDGDCVVSIGSFSTKVSDSDFVDVAFVTVCGNRLYVGEFYYASVYPTLDSHKMTTSAGDYQQAIALEYALTENGYFGIDPTPVAAYSLPDKVQGMTIEGDSIYLSTSYGLAASYIYEHALSELVREGQISVLGHDLPLYAIDSASLAGAYEIAPMSEEIVMLDGRLYVMCESASNKYFFGKLTGGEWCYATDLTAMKQK